MTPDQQARERLARHAYTLAQLRHAYKQAFDFNIGDQRNFAKFLLAPAIETMEQQQADLARLRALEELLRDVREYVADAVEAAKHEYHMNQPYPVRGELQDERAVLSRIDAALHAQNTEVGR